MTNEERIKSMSTEELMQFMEDVRAIKGFEYTDLEKWLKSESEEMIYRGKNALLHWQDGRKEACVYVDDKTAWDGERRIVITADNIYNVPADEVEVENGEEISGAENQQ